MVNMSDMFDALIMLSTWNRFVGLESVIVIDFIYMVDNIIVVFVDFFYGTAVVVLISSLMLMMMLL